MSTSQPSSDDAYLCGTTPHGYTTHESQTFSHTSIDTVSILSSSSIDTAEVEGVVKEISLNQALFNELRSQEALPGQPLAQTLSGQLQDQAQPDVMDLESVGGDAESLRFQYHPMDDLLLPQNTSPPPASSKKKGSQPKTVYREQDRFVPLHNVARIMRHAIPANGKVSKDAKECMQECVSECVSFITSEASDKCIAEKRKTINGDDILFAMATLGFDNYVEPLKLYLQKYREFTRADRSPSTLPGRDAS